MRTQLLFELVPVGSYWPSGTYESAAVLDISMNDIERILVCRLHTGIEAGLGPWSAIGLRLASGAHIELIEYVHCPTRGVELRVDRDCDLRSALEATLSLLDIPFDAVRWRSPFI